MCFGTKAENPFLMPGRADSLHTAVSSKWESAMSVQNQSNSAAPSSSTIRIDVKESQSARRTIIATASATGDQPSIRIACSGTNRLVAADGTTACSATQIFAVDAGFSPWVEVTVEGPGRSYDLALAVAALAD